MAVEKDFELLDDYLSNRLSGDERVEFEKKLEADPELNQELKTQQELIEGIRKARTLELKSMLNTVPVSPIQGGQTSALTKISALAVVTGIVVTGIYFYFSEGNSKETAKEPTPAQQEETKAITPSEVVPQETESVEVKEPVEAVEKPQKEKQSETNAVVTTPQPQPALEVYDPTKEEAEKAIQKYENEQLEIISKAFVTSSIEVETENTNKKYGFHYVFKDGKLVLYGSFEKHLYEILEFINDADKKRTVVLYYKSNYYLLDIAKSTPTLLSPIKNGALLKKLHEYRVN